MGRPYILCGTIERTDKRGAVQALSFFFQVLNVSPLDNAIVGNLSRTTGRATASERIYLQMKAVDLINGEFREGTECEVAAVAKH